MKKIVIVGGGIVGLTCAYYLSKDKNIQVMLIDDGVGQASKNAAGIICPWLSLRRNKIWLKLVDAGAKFYPKLMKDLSLDGIQTLPYKQCGTYVLKKDIQTIEKILLQVNKNMALGVHPGKISFYNEAELKTLIPDLKQQYYGLFAHNGGKVDGENLIETLKSCFIKNGGIFKNGNASFFRKQLFLNDTLIEYDELILACGAWLKSMLELEYEVDIYPQKGQLIKLHSDLLTDDVPGIMLQGEADILPQNNGTIAIGATHENEQGFNLDVDLNIINKMKNSVLSQIDIHDYNSVSYHVGTRAYTSDFTPFFGKFDSFYVVSGLGSSGLTSGPFIAHHIANRILNKQADENYPDFDPNKYILKK